MLLQCSIIVPSQRICTLFMTSGKIKILISIVKNKLMGGSFLLSQGIKRTSPERVQLATKFGVTISGWDDFWGKRHA